ncbi:amino acid permease [Methanosarcina horonobensis]|uniref:amino acid permease n=1 Tax=Methanosarcina horonobensis TaxID=418008 RepID=UPI0022B901F6|nr:amino acid permease [Methanosarcina horonobensis]
MPLLYWLSFALVTSIYIVLALIIAGASVAGVPLQGAAGLSGLVLFTPGGSLLIWLMVIVIAANACSWNFTASRLLYAGGRTGAFPGAFGKLSKRNIPVSSLVGLYVLSILLILGTYIFKIPVSTMMLLVNQNFVFLYAFIILAYWKTETGRQKWVFSVLALLSLGFLISGFTWKIVYPVFLIGFGYYRFIGKRSLDKTNKQGKEIIVREDAQELPYPIRH